jgi:hypothetical protein
MSTTQDELAGVVDLFGALTRSELASALHELAFKQGRDVDESALRSEIEAAIDAYSLVEYEPDDTAGLPTESATDEVSLVAVGPTAFQTLPPNATDLPHILDYDRRTVDRERLADQVCERLAVEAETAVAAGDTERASQLLDVSYDVEAWVAVDTAEIRSTIEPVLPQL